MGTIASEAEPGANREDDEEEEEHEEDGPPVHDGWMCKLEYVVRYGLERLIVMANGGVMSSSGTQVRLHSSFSLGRCGGAGTLSLARSSALRFMLFRTQHLPSRAYQSPLL